jgi:hypothetical protein
MVGHPSYGRPESCQRLKVEQAVGCPEAFTGLRQRGMFGVPMEHLSKFLSITSLLVVACGRPASERECNEIVTRTATLEYQAAVKGTATVDPAQIETIRARVRESMLKNCVGRRITEKALQCVREAKSAKEIQDRCFD